MNPKAKTLNREEASIRMLEADPHSIKNIKNPSEDEMMYAIDLDPNVIQYFADRASQDARWNALRGDPKTVFFFPSPTVEEQEFVIDQFQGVGKANEALNPQNKKIIGSWSWKLRSFWHGLWNYCN
jgi:hypothetical protein